MPKIPDRVYIDKKDRELYNKLAEEEIFDEKTTRKEQFLFAMAVGFNNQLRLPLETREGFFLTKDLRPEDEALMYAVAIYDEGPEILSNKEKVFKIAEEYAHGGIKILTDMVKSLPYGSFYKKLEKDLSNLYKKLEIRE